jgi:hypothetical protein
MKKSFIVGFFLLQIVIFARCMDENKKSVVKIILNEKDGKESFRSILSENLEFKKVCTKFLLPESDKEALKDMFEMLRYSDAGNIEYLLKESPLCVVLSCSDKNKEVFTLKLKEDT